MTCRATLLSAVRLSARPPAPICSASVWSLSLLQRRVTAGSMPSACTTPRVRRAARGPALGVPRGPAAQGAAAAEAFLHALDLLARKPVVHYRERDHDQRA